MPKTAGSPPDALLGDFASPALDALVRYGHDGTVTCRAVASITSGLRWKPVQAPTVCRGQWDESFVEQANELGTAMAAGLEMGVF